MANIGIERLGDGVVEIRHDVMLCQRLLGFAQIVTVFQALIVALSEGKHVDGDILDRCIKEPWFAADKNITISAHRSAIAMSELFTEGFKAAFDDMLGYVDAIAKMFESKGHPFDKDVVGILNAAIQYLKKIEGVGDEEC